MTTFWQYAVFGLGASAIYTLLALGLIVIYSGSGVLNFAQAAMATLGAYLYFEMRYIHGWGFWPAFLFGVGGDHGARHPHLPPRDETACETRPPSRRRSPASAS